MVHIVAKSSIDQTMYLRCLMHAQSWRLARLLEPNGSNPRNFPIWGAKPRWSRYVKVINVPHGGILGAGVYIPLPQDRSCKEITGHTSTAEKCLNDTACTKAIKKHRNHRYCGRTSFMKAILSSLA